MKCSKAEKYLDEFAAGRLADPERLALESHLEACAACKRELAAAHRLERMCETAKLGSAPNLQFRIQDAIRQDSSPRIKEKHMKNRKLTIGVGLATLLCAAAVGAFTLMPRSAMAVIKRSIKAVKSVTTAKVDISWNTNGARHTRTVWSDHDRTRDQWEDHLSVYKNGKGTDDPEKDLYTGRIDPTDWTLDHQLDIYEAGLTPVDLGLRNVDGRELRLVRIERTTIQGVPERWDYYMDDNTNLPAVFVGLQQSNGQWIETWSAKYQFNIPLENSLFDLPAGKTWHQLPDQDVKPVEVIDGVTPELDGPGNGASAAPARK